MINIENMNKSELIELIENNSETINDELKLQARKTCDKVFGNKVYLRGLINISSHCKNNCYYCGISGRNKKAERYRLSEAEILSCCKTGNGLGVSTFVLQGGEDEIISDLDICRTVSKIKDKYPDSVVTLSLGEKDKATYTEYFFAGADRYLLRHETASSEHYRKMHPKTMSLNRRKDCLRTLKEIGFQVGAGFMVGSPFQTSETLAEDILFLNKLKPHIVGVGPFIPHKDTKFAGYPPGSLELTLNLISMIRILLKDVLIPATTALGTIHEEGRELGIKHGANVVMSNLSPASVRKKYLIYDGKICVNEEASESLNCLKERVRNAGFEIDMSSGDHPEF